MADWTALANFRAAAAERYDCDGTNDAPGHPCVHTWSFYSEPDRDSRWGYNGAAYAAMLAQVSPAIHAAAPHSQVMIGGLAYDWFVEEGGSYVRTFLSNVLQTLNSYPGGAAAYIDAVAFHYYPINDGWASVREKGLEVRGIMTQHGVGDLPLLCPEMGFWSSTKFDSSEAQQARLIVQNYVRGMSASITLMSYYKVFDDAIAGSSADTGPAHTSGLIKVDGTTLKPAYYAYQTLTQELYHARYVRSLGVSKAEGYVFKMLDGHEKTVLWATSTTAQVRFTTSCIRMVDVLGRVYSPLRDGDSNWDADHTVNGQILLQVYKNAPVYVENCQ